MRFWGIVVLLCFVVLGCGTSHDSPVDGGEESDSAVGADRVGPGDGSSIPEAALRDSHSYGQVDGSLGDSGLTTDGADGALLGADAAADAAVEASLDADAMTDGWDGALLDASPPVDGAAEAAVDSGATVDGARSESGTQVDGPDGGAMALDSGVDGEAGSIRSEGGVDSGVDASDGGPPIEDEVGFVDVPRQRTAATYPARMFYVFEAADSDPAPQSRRSHF